MNFGLVNLDPDTFRIGCVWGLTHLSCAPETPHIIRVRTPSGNTKEFDLLEPDSIDRILETITCTKVVK